jgi:alkylation response protein AidB-like acyl-CoA dehydrogenase
MIIVWENVFVPDKDVIDRPARVIDTFINLLCSWGIPPLDVCYLGIAQAARDYAIEWTSTRTQVPFDRPMSHYPHSQFLAAEMEVGLRAARAMVAQTADPLGDLQARVNPSLTDLIACHQFVMETALSVVDRAMRLVGGAALFRSSPFEQMYRDARAAIPHQPFAGYDGIS